MVGEALRASVQEGMVCVGNPKSVHQQVLTLEKCEPFVDTDCTVVVTSGLVVRILLQEEWGPPLGRMQPTNGFSIMGTLKGLLLWHASPVILSWDVR